MSKHDLKKLAKLNIKILSNNKIKLRKGQKISIKPIVEESLKDAIVSRLDGIIDANTQKYESSHIIKSEATALSQIKMSDIITHASTNKNIVPTVVHVVTKKNALDFDFAGEGIIGDLLRSSTLGPTYQKIKDGWKSLNTDDSTSFTNVLFIPNIFVFTNGIETLLNPFKVNLLLIAEPSYKLFKEDFSESTDQDKISRLYLERVYGDIMDAAVKIKGCSDLIINPFEVKASKDNQHEVIDIWNFLIDSTRCRESISSIWFSIENEYDYILFIAEKGVKKMVDEVPFETIPFDSIPDGDDEEDDDVLDDITDEIVSDIEENNNNKKKKVKELLEDDED